MMLKFGGPSGMDRFVMTAPLRRPRVLVAPKPAARKHAAGSEKRAEQIIALCVAGKQPSAVARDYVASNMSVEAVARDLITKMAARKRKPAGNLQDFAAYVRSKVAAPLLLLGLLLAPGTSTHAQTFPPPPSGVRVTFGTGVPTGPNSAGDLYVDNAATPPGLYWGLGGTSWSARSLTLDTTCNTNNQIPRLNLSTGRLQCVPLLGSGITVTHNANDITLTGSAGAGLPGANIVDTDWTGKAGAAAGRITYSGGAVRLFGDATTGNTNMYVTRPLPTSCTTPPCAFEAFFTFTATPTEGMYGVTGPFLTSSDPAGSGRIWANCNVEYLNNRLATWVKNTDSGAAAGYADWGGGSSPRRIVYGLVTMSIAHNPTASPVTIDGRTIPAITTQCRFWPDPYRRAGHIVLGSRTEPTDFTAARIGFHVANVNNTLESTLIRYEAVQ